MNIDFKSMDGRKKKLYCALWENNDFINKNANLIEKSTSSRYKKPSRNSYCFAGKGKTEDLLTNVFKPDDPDLFKEKFSMAVSGSGHELPKICTLHSSSLCALLHFYNITDKKPLILNGLETSKTKRTIKFTKSLFEYKSPVINPNHPSNMDVVLIGKDMESDEDIVFFLESKFSEYYTGAGKKSTAISTKYFQEKYFSAPLYKDDVLDKMGFQVADKNTKSFKLLSKAEPFYIGGIKQMISHYTGIRNVLKGSYFPETDRDKAVKQNEVNDLLKNGATVILGEIVFDRFIGDLELKPGLKCGAIYSQKYEILADEIGKLIKNEKVERFEILKKELGYSLFLTNPHKTEDRIRQFYREE